ncbi:MAG: REP-associated tyrosine transposase [Pseudomonadota bacterium]
MPYNDLRKGRYSQPGHITTVTQGRQPRFAELEKGRMVVRIMMAMQQEGLAATLCFVVMPDHLHWLMAPRGEVLAEVVRRFKGRSARCLGGPLWQPGFHDHAMREEEDVLKTARYIVANPLRAGLVQKIGDYPLWDAVWL